MLNNKQIAARFDLLAKVMELHGENRFKINSYANAFNTLRKLEGDLAIMERKDLESIPGVGKNIADKIQELLTSGELSTLNKYINLTPEGIIEMLSIKGLGPKKVEQIWKAMGIETVGELLYACQENRLVKFKGFGPKMQEEIQTKLEYHLESKGKYLYAHVEKLAFQLLGLLRDNFPNEKFELGGDFRRALPEVSKLDIFTSLKNQNINLEGWALIENKAYYKSMPVEMSYSEDICVDVFKSSCSEAFLSRFDIISKTFESEEDIFATHGLNFIPIECRESETTVDLYKGTIPRLVEVKDIKGIVHNHSTYSDGLHTLAQMSDYIQHCGFEYFVISDHSQSATYADGLKHEHVTAQWKEIDLLNKKYGSAFKVYKGIECDILSDGRLDYSDEILAGFDVVIASIHSGLSMDEKRATQRLIKAVENPYTRILGHPTGRLLLARPGYPIDYKKVIDACAANHVVIELNANPQRLDLDWSWIEYCMEKGVKMTINPDAHSKESIHYIKYGTLMARKGGLTKDMCLNALSKLEFDMWINAK